MNPKQKTLSANRRETFSVLQVNLELERRIARYHRMLHSLAYRVLDNHSDAEDAVQSCLLSVRRSIRSFEHEGSFRAWLVRVLLDKALAILRREQGEIGDNLK